MEAIGSEKCLCMRWGTLLTGPICCGWQNDLVRDVQMRRSVVSVVMGWMRSN